MKYSSLAALVAASALSFSASAAVISSDILPTDANMAGVTDNTAPAGKGAWQATTLGQADAKSFAWLYWNSGSDNFTLGDLASLQFSTNKPVDGAAQDFYISIYTTPDGVEDAGWYGQRLTFESIYAKNVNSTANSWTTWSTDEGENQLRVFDYGSLGSYQAPTLAELLDPLYQDDDVTSFAQVDYASETLKGIALSTGSGWASSFTGRVDDVRLNFGQNQDMTFDLEPAAVSAPATLGMLLLGGLGLMRRRRG